MIKDAGLVHQHKVGSTHQARRAEARGVDVIIASGFEMGGHTHTRPVHTVVLGPNVTEAVDVPVLLSGGFRDGRGLAAALCFGAEREHRMAPELRAGTARRPGGRRHHLSRILRPRPRAAKSGIRPPRIGHRGRPGR
jgi:hypothetical protein